MFRLSVVLWFLLGAVVSAQSDSDPAMKALADRFDASNRLAAMKAVSCTFGEGTIRTLSAVEEPEPEATSMASPIIFSNIDIKGRKAVMGGNQGGANVLVLLGKGGLTFVEITEAGNIVTTTIFPSRPRVGTKALLAVHSRHISAFPLGTNAIVSQYYGQCIPVE